jgi:hypothetical protein
MLRKNALQCTIDSVGMHIAQAKRDHTGQRGSASGDQFSKAKIMGQQNASLPSRLLYNVAVWPTLKTLGGEMHRIVVESL